MTVVMVVTTAATIDPTSVTPVTAIIDPTMVRTIEGIAETAVPVVAVDDEIVMAQLEIPQAAISATNRITLLPIVPTSTASVEVTGVMGCIVVIDVTTRCVV